MGKLPEIELVISAQRISLKDVPELEIGLKITNRSREYLPVNLSGLALFVNSARSVAWDLTMQNGTLVNLRLAPDQHETLLWKMGEALFESAGKYQLILSDGEIFIARQIVEITNDPKK
jgi:hypothetical protein